MTQNALNVLHNGIVMCRRAMRADAQEWRLLCAIGAKPHFRLEAIRKAVEARDAANDLQRQYQAALVAITSPLAGVQPPSEPIGFDGRNSSF